MLSKCSQDTNLKHLWLGKGQPTSFLMKSDLLRRCLSVMVMFTSRAHNMSDVSEMEEIATHVLVVEVVCHHGRTRYIFQVITFAKLNASCPVSLICDNCPTNQGVYDKFRGQGRLYFERLGRYVYCVCDYVHIFENFRNNWITSGDDITSFIQPFKAVTPHGPRGTKLISHVDTGTFIFNIHHCESICFNL